MNPASPNKQDDTRTPTITPTHTKMSPDSTIDWWSSWADILGVSAVIIGGILAVVTAIGWGFSFKAGKLKDAALEREGIEAQQQIAESNEKAEEAKNNAAQAIERAAQTQLEAEQLKAQLAWRALTSADFDKLVAALSPHPHWGVVIGYVANDPESTALLCNCTKPFGRPDGRRPAMRTNTPAH